LACPGIKVVNQDARGANRGNRETMHQSPRIRRLRNDFVALERLRSESSIFRFTAQGDPPHLYAIVYKGRSLWRDRGKVKTLETHRIEIKLGSSYPRTIPELRWITPVYHPNISEIGMVCLGGYGTHWVPSVQLDELCVMLWDMARYHNYDIRSPYNREAALWVANQTNFRFPTDERPLRDLRAALGRIEQPAASAPDDKHANGAVASGGGRRSARRTTVSDSDSPAGRVRHFINQYGQIFSKGRSTTPAGPTSTPSPDDSAPMISVEAASVPLEPGEAPVTAEVTNGEMVFELIPAARPEPEAPRAGASTESPGTSIVFEPIPCQPREPAMPRGGEEIVFID
jgi:ubiquitin-protein ligase